MPAYYAFSPALDPLTGDVKFSQTRSSWTEGQPLVEKVIRCLRTPKGSALRDPTYGVDAGAFENARENAPAEAEAAIRAALQRFISRGELTDLAVEVEAQGTSLVFEVRFKDPRDPAAVLGPVTGTL